ncbi:MAG: substrate-binding domain-containing protein, partial [Turicibacter sp.]|nr:substrate-binding domain-containing protein [Turicibacter sp.]
FKLTHQLMSLQNPPSAIFTVTDNLAIGCMEYLKENNYSIPDDVAIMGLGDLKISAYMTPRLTTIHYYFKTMGTKSANLLIQLIQSGKESSRNCESNFTFKYRLMERDSV